MDQIPATMTLRAAYRRWHIATMRAGRWRRETMDASWNGTTAAAYNGGPVFPPIPWLSPPNLKTLLTQHQIETAVAQLARRLNDDCARRPLTLIGVMTGSFVFMADLIRLLQMPLRVGVVQASSYRGTSRGELAINSEMMPDIAGRDVLLVDDIFDTGHTLVQVLKLMHELQPASVRTAVLLVKEGRQEVDLRPDYVAFQIPDEFVVGYGLDYQDEYRNLSYIAGLEPDDIAGK